MSGLKSKGAILRILLCVCVCFVQQQYTHTYRKRDRDPQAYCNLLCTKAATIYQTPTVFRPSPKSRKELLPFVAEKMEVQREAG